jgi:hypothetical protein
MDPTTGAARSTLMRTKALVLIVFVGWASPGEAQRSPSLVPQDWIQQTRQSQSDPLRYSSPDGRAWLTLSATPADKHGRLSLKATGDEQITYRRVTPRFVAVSGFRGDLIFYRKSNLACNGTRWHHITLDYPAEDKLKMDQLVTRVAHGMNHFDKDCRGSPSKTSGGLVGIH